MGKSEPVCIPSYSLPDKDGQQDHRSSVSEVDYHRSGLAQHALVLGSGGIFVPDIIVPAKLSGPTDNDSLPRDLQNLNLHAWLFEPRLFGKKVSLIRWHRELKHFRDILPDLSEAKQSGPVLFDGARQIWWTARSIEQISDALCTCFRKESYSLV